MESILGYFEPISLDNWSLEPHLVHHLKIVKKLQQGLTIITVKFVYSNQTQNTTASARHVVKPGTPKRNHRNETTGTKLPEPPERNRQNNRNKLSRHRK